MILLHRIGPRWNSNFNHLDEILALDKDEPISFDGVYTEIWNLKDRLKHFTNVTLFVCGQHVGGDNAFDKGQPEGEFCSWFQVAHLRDNYGWRLGWHSYSHRDLTTLSPDDVRTELITPFPMKTFAYPYGRLNDRVADLVQEAGFEEAWSVFQGNGSPYQKNRSYLNW